MVILPYAKGFSERIAKDLRGFNMKVIHKPIQTISKILKKPKDKIEKEASRGIVQDQMYRLGLCLHRSDITCAKNMPQRARKGHSNIR